MSLHRISIVLLCLFAFALNGCSKSSGGGSSNIRVFNAVPDSGAITVFAQTTQLAAGLPFEGLTLYEGVSGGANEFKVSVAGSSGNIIDQTFQVSGGTNYTYIVYGPTSSVINQLIADNVPTAPTGGNFNFRVTNAADGVGVVDVYLTTPGAPIGSVSPTVGNVPFSATSQFAMVAAGSYEMRLTTANTKQVIYDTGAQTFATGTSVEAIIYSRESSALVNVAVLNIDDTGTGAVENNLLANFKVVNAAPGSPPLNVFVDSVLSLSNIPYLGASSYSTINAGTSTFVVEATATPGQHC